ncbi:MAG: FHA domain-containing protein [Bacteroidetes bacterium]|nr:FHA domain-containing protein [Bacteroidota bacterium]
MKRVLSLFIGIFVSVSIWSQQEVTIENIVNNPGPFLEENVVVEGTVEQFVPETSTTNAHYLLEGKYGGIIKVKTSEAEPQKNKMYRVEGTVYDENGRPFIHEASKICIDCESAKIFPENQVKEKNYLLYIIIAATFILLLIIIFYIIQNQKSKADKERKRKEEELRKVEEDRINRAKEQKTIETPDDDFKTLKFSSSDPKTMKYVPGKLEIISGEDKGRILKFFGYPTPEGSVVSVGRGKGRVEGERSFARIKIDDKFMTVSREQAELIYREGKLFVRNLSNINPTEVNGIVVPEKEMIELEPGSVMKTGELEFKYVV